MTDDNASPDAVVIERSFDAPLDLIWRMWTEPEHFAAWYGPEGTSIPVAKMDVRVGGTRLVCMEVQTPNGPMQMWFTGEYREVSENTRLVYTESICDEDGNVWSSAGWVGDGYDGVHVFAPDGTRIGQIRLPEICSNVCFGGAKRNRLFMTASQSLYSVFVETRGAHIT